MVYNNNRAVSVCAHCKALNYEQNEHRCKIILANPGLDPKDLTLHDELYDKDPYRLIWKNWEDAVNYQEKLIKRSDSDQSELDEEE